MGMEPLSSISSMQVQTMTRPATTPKVNNDVAEGTASEVTVPKMDSNTIAVAKSHEGNGKQKQGQEGQESQQQISEQFL